MRNKISNEHKNNVDMSLIEKCCLDLHHFTSQSTDCLIIVWWRGLHFSQCSPNQIVFIILLLIFAKSEINRDNVANLWFLNGTLFSVWQVPFVKQFIHLEFCSLGHWNWRLKTETGVAQNYSDLTQLTR